MNLKLTIITINYNNSKGLERTIASVNNQNFNQFEFIIIDGASTDSSLSVIKKNKSSINYFISEPDSGIYNAMNKGIKQSSGDYILFLNSGDILNGNNILSKFINNTNFKGDIIYGDYKFNEGEKIYPDKLTPLFFIKSSLPHQSTFFKRIVFDVMGLYNENYKIASDREFYIKCFLSGKFEFTHIKYPLTVYDLKGISNSKEYNVLKIQEDEIIFKNYYGIFYEDYLKYLKLEKTNSKLKRNTFKGYLKRIKKRLKLK